MDNPVIHASCYLIFGVIVTPVALLFMYLAKAFIGWPEDVWLQFFAYFLIAFVAAWAMWIVFVIAMLVLVFFPFTCNWFYRNRVKNGRTEEEDTP